MIRTIVKIDLCGSKKFATARETENPEIRAETLKSLLSVSQQTFPQASEPYPAGSYYKAEGDAVYYVLEKPTVALRASIEFMQKWFNQLPNFPECRVILERGDIQEVKVPSKMELTGKPFENIAVIEKNLGDGKIFLTDSVFKNVDQTVSKFSFLFPKKIHAETIRIYWVDFLDPRTVADSSLIHALFIAHPKAAEARSRVFELFMLECLLEKMKAVTTAEILEWGKSKNYPMPTSEILLHVVKGSDFLDFDNSTQTISIKPIAKKYVESAQADFLNAK
ncbi:MAG: hypothetical protein M0Z32_02655 [Actinomycetota bacterium]|nr:hypothetical protein [Actinomycetota bacterium]MCL6093802.1 hypothetical protein [Actinomycetota bacterium]MDA8166638.1 hypothetical protein [Actinomycetota bacterium]